MNYLNVLCVHSCFGFKVNFLNMSTTVKCYSIHYDIDGVNGHTFFLQMQLDEIFQKMLVKDKPT